MQGRRERKRGWAIVALVVACAALCSARPAAAQQASFWTDDALTTGWNAMNGPVPLFEWGDTGWMRFQREATPSWFVFRRGLYSAPIVLSMRRQGTLPNWNDPRVFQVICSKSVVASRGADYATYNPRLSPARVGIDFGFYCAPGDDPRDPAKWALGRAQLAKSFTPGDPPVVAEVPAAGFWGDPANKPVAMLTPGVWEVRVHQNEDFADRNGSYTDTNPEPLTNDVHGDGRYDYPEPFNDLNGNGVWDAGEPFLDMGNGWYDPPEPFVDENTNGVWDHDDTNGNGIVDAGEDHEPFTDWNNNKRWDGGEPFDDANGNGYWDPPEPFVDYNGNNVRDPDEPFMDLNGNGVYDNGETFTDQGNGEYDPGDSYTDTNQNGQFDPGDYWIDLNGNGVWDPALGEPGFDRYGNGRYDVGEPFLDENGNGVWDLRSEPFVDANGNGEVDPGEFTDHKYFEAGGNGEFDAAVVGPETIRVMNPISVLAGGGVPPWVESPAANWANGNPDFPPVAGKRVLPGLASAPAWSFGRVGHGATSTSYRFAVVDRSRLDQVPYLASAGPRLRCRIGHGDMNPTQDAAHPPTNMDWWYDLEEYPPIFDDRLVIRKVGEPRDPRLEGIDLPLRGEPWVDQNGNGEYDPGEPFSDENGNGVRDAGTLKPVYFEAYVRVPRYQPDTTYGTGWDAVPQDATRLPAITGIPASDPIRVWCDLDDDGKLLRIPSAVATPDEPLLCDPEYYTDPARMDGTERMAAYELCDDPTAAEARLWAEPYREFNLTLNVPPDFRFRVEEPALDLGKQPHNTAASTGRPHPWSARPLTITNLGNVNLLNLRIAPDRAYLSARDPRRSGCLYTPDSDYDALALYNAAAADKGSATSGLGVRIPWGTPEPGVSDVPEQPTTPYTRKYVWWSFGGDDPANPDPNRWEDATGNAFLAGALRKARPDAPSPSVLRGRWHAGASWTESGYVGPRVGVITPFGQPVGDYSNQFVVYEDSNDNGILDTGDYPALGAFQVKVTVTDRQLTEEPTAYSIDRPVVGSVGNADPALDYAGTFVAWAIPHPTDASKTRYIFSGDSQPAVVRFWDSSATNHRRLALFWTSNRRDDLFGGGGRQPQPPAAAVAAHEQSQSWYLYGSRSYEIKDRPEAYWPFWANRYPHYDLSDAGTRIASAAPPEMKAPGASLFDGKLANAGTILSERYTAPSIVQTIAASGQIGQPYYLFFQGTGQGRDDGGRTYRASQIFYTALGPDFTLNSAAPIVPVGLEQPEVVKHTPRALSYVDATGVHRLWAFWHGGAENAWQGYFSVNRGDKALASDWKLEDGRGFGILPLYGDFATVQDLVPLYRPGPHTNFLTGATIAEPMIDLIFTGFSKSRGNSDLYMARLDPAQLMWGTRGAWRAKQPFAPVEKELLVNRNNRVYTSRNLEWMTSPLYRTTMSGRRFVFPRIWWRPAGSTTLQLITPDPENATHAPSSRRWATGTWRYDRDGSRWIYDWKDAPTAYGVGNTITVYPLTGQVVFAKPLNPGDEIYADYVPTILRVAGSPQMDASPAAFVDTRIGPAQSPVDGTRVYRQRDRLWLFWTRVAPQVSKPTVWYKTMRLMVQLPRAIQPGTEVTVTDEFGGAITQFTIDTGVHPTTGQILYPGRLYFPASQMAGVARGLEGRRITVSYTEAGTGAAGAQPADPYIRWRDERPEAPLPIDDVANEGSLCAIPDLPLTDADSINEYLSDAGAWRVWLFWTSSRPKAIVYDASTGQPRQFSNDTDLRYMTLAPRLDFRPTLPGAPSP
jgi:hypothetical protein